jgi:hypothetical protein
MTEYNQISFRTVSSTSNAWYLKYPGFCSLQTKKQNEKEPFFLSGVGQVNQTSCNEFNVGDFVLFAGFANKESNEYSTTKNALVKIPQGAVDASKIGIAAQMVYATSMLNPQAGMHFYIAPNIKECELLAEIISSVGCIADKTMDESKWYDGAIVFDAIDSKVRLTNSAKVIFLSRSGPYCCNSLGQDFCNEMYMIRGCEVPKHYLYATTAKNIAVAYQLLNKPTFTQKSNSISVELLSKDSFAERMRTGFEDHINPASISIAIRNSDTEYAKNLAKKIASYITQTEADVEQQFSIGDNLLSKIVFFDGSVADCLSIKSEIESVDVEMHFDRTSFVYKNNYYQEYRGTKETFEKELPKACLSTTDIAILMKE